MSRRIVGITLVTALLAGVAVGAQASLAVAALSWKAPTTVKTVRGVPDPMAAIDRNGRATIVFSDATPADERTGGPEARRRGVFAVTRTPGSDFGPPTRIGDGGTPRIAVTPDGLVAVAWLDGDLIRVMLQAGPGRLGSAATYQAIDAVDGVDDLRLVVDAAGRATVVWTSPKPNGAPDVQVRAATVTASAAGEAQALGAPGPCSQLSADANLAGDIAVLCPRRDRIYVRDSGAELFQAALLAEMAHGVSGYVLVDGAGTVTVVVPTRLSLSWTSFWLRPRGGAFGPRRQLDGPVELYGQEARTVAVRYEGGATVYWIRPASAEAFGSPQPFTDGGPDAAPAFLPAVAPLGALPLLALSDQALPAPMATFAALSIGDDGRARAVGEPRVPGAIDFPGNVAGSQVGLAVATWEQRCGNGFAVMAMVLDERRGTTEPPCQDTAAPKVAVRPQRARLVGRKLRVRIGCDEACRMVVRARVLRGGKGRPLATAKTRRAKPIASGRYRSFSLRLTKRQAAKVRTALAARRRVSVRLALSVRDGFENGAVRRVAVPLRR